MNAKELRALLAGDDELALLDVREQGVHYRGHPFFACSAPLSRLELMIADLVPRRDVRVVLLDGGGEGLAEKASVRLEALGYTRVSILEDGCEGWKSGGGELFSGVNVLRRRSASSSSIATRRRASLRATCSTFFRPGEKPSSSIRGRSRNTPA